MEVSANGYNLDKKTWSFGRNSSFGVESLEEYMEIVPLNPKGWLCDGFTSEKRGICSVIAHAGHCACSIGEYDG